MSDRCTACGEETDDCELMVNGNLCARCWASAAEEDDENEDNDE